MNTRHIACKICRERKVRCPGQQPTCDRCRRAGEQCVYMPQQRQSRATASDLSATVEALQKRLNDAEALIFTMSGRMGNGTGTVGLPPNPSWAVDSDIQIPSPERSFIRNQDDSIYQCNVQVSESHLLQDTIGHDDSDGRAGSGIGEAVHFDDALMDFECTLAPSHNGEPSCTPSQGSPVAAILPPLAAYCSSVIRREAEVGGLATAVAEYMAWMRAVPATAGAAPPVTTPVYQQMLANIETRVREVVEICERKDEDGGYGAPLTDLLGALAVSDGGGAGGDGDGGGAMPAKVAALEEDLQRQVREQRAFFRTRYDACKMLKDQVETRP